MMFIRVNKKGDQVRRRVCLDCSNDEPIVEQSHKAEVDINNIVKRHGMDLIQKTALLQSKLYQFDDVTGNDFQEAMFKVAKAKESFLRMPSEIRKRFDNDAAKFLDFVQNPDNSEQLVEMGLALPPVPDDPVSVRVIQDQPTPGAHPSAEPQGSAPDQAQATEGA